MRRLILLAALVACTKGPPKRLIPEGAKVIRELPRREEQCYVHRTWTMSTTDEAATAWAAKNVLPCADEAVRCAHWSTSKRKDPSWKNAASEPQGLDTVDATYGSGQMTVDWGDYTCSGPN